MTEKIINEWYQEKQLPAAIIPIPLHQNRLKQRGFNQAAEIARPISKALKIPLIVNGLVRFKETQSQSNLGAFERRRNVNNAFRSKKYFKNQDIAVIDDVMTTGNTVYEFCKVLKKQGARRISVWCCARCSD